MKNNFLTCIKKLVHKCELVQQCVYKNFKSLNNLINKNEKKIFCNVEKKLVHKCELVPKCVYKNF